MAYALKVAHSKQVVRGIVPYGKFCIFEKVLDVRVVACILQLKGSLGPQVQCNFGADSDNVSGGNRLN